jgi:rare lipoprotein A
MARLPRTPILIGFLLFAVVACTQQTPPPQEVPPPPPPPPVPSANANPSAVIEHGKASYYADNFDGRTTASGAPMDQNALTAASKDLPLGTKATVINLETGKSVDVEVNDRGPYVPGRIIDVSKRAADELDLKKDGVARVKVVAKPENQPTPELKDKVAKTAARKAAKHHRAHHQAPPPIQEASTGAPPPSPPQ